MRLFLLLLSAVFPLALDASVLEGPVERGEAFSFLVVPLAASFDLQSERNADDGRMVLLLLTAEGGAARSPRQPVCGKAGTQGARSKCPRSLVVA